MTDQLQDMFKTVLQAIRPPTFYVMRNPDTGEHQHYTGETPFEESMEILRASWYMGGDEQGFRRTLWIVQITLSEEFGGLLVQSGSDSSGVIPLQPFSVAGVQGQVKPGYLVALVAPSVEALAVRLKAWVDEKYEQHRCCAVEQRL